jgi:hypothetical protein
MLSLSLTTCYRHAIQSVWSRERIFPLRLDQPGALGRSSPPASRRNFPLPRSTGSARAELATGARTSDEGSR